MFRITRKTIKHLAEKPKTLFLIDSLGALLTAFLLFIVLRNYNECFGMPEAILTTLSAIAAGFFIFSISCFLLLNKNWIPFIMCIVTVNILYCILTIILLIFYYPQLTILGITYFIGEIVIIAGLVYIELNVAKEIRRNI